MLNMFFTPRPSIFTSHPYYLLVLVSLILLPFFTYYISTTLFLRTAKTREHGKIPPTVPYWLPGIFHGFQTAASGRSKFLADTIRDYGDFAPFMVRSGLEAYILLRDPQHIKKALASGNLSHCSQQARLLDKVIGAPKGFVDAYTSPDARSKQEEHLRVAHEVLPRKYFEHDRLAPLIEEYMSVFRRNMADKMFQERTWTEIEDLWWFFQNEISRACIESIYGSAILKTYPKIVRDYWDLNNKVDDLLSGLPKFVASSAHAARLRLHSKTAEWLKAKKQEDDHELHETDWDELRGSSYFQHRDAAVMRAFPNDEARVADALLLLHQLLSDTVPTTIWSIFEVLRDAAISKQLSVLIKDHSNVDQADYNISDLTTHSVFHSLHQEVCRLRRATCIDGTIKGNDLELDNTWIVPKGANVIVLSQDLALNAQAWSQTRPRSVAKPLEEFWAGRFMTASQLNRNKQTAIPENAASSMDALGELNISFRSPTGNRPEENFVRGIEVATLALLLNEFELQLSDPESAGASIPPLREYAYGTVKPLDRVRVRVRKRPALNK